MLLSYNIFNILYLLPLKNTKKGNLLNQSPLAPIYFSPNFLTYTQKEEDHDETKIHGKEEFPFFLLATNLQVRILI